MAAEKSPKYILPVELAEKLICSYCHEYLSCGPIKMQKEKYICGRCTAKGDAEVVLPHIFEIILANSIFPCKYYKEGCKKTIQFNDFQKHESNCFHRKIPCPELNCTQAVLLFNLLDHFKEHHLSGIIENDQFKLDLDENNKQNLLKYESDCIIVIKYHYSRATKTLQLSVALVNEKPRTVAKYKLQICNGNDLDTNINLSQKLCHLYNNQRLEKEEFDDININDCLSVLKNPKIVIIKIFLVYSNNIFQSTKTLFTDQTEEDAQLERVMEENAIETLQNLITNQNNYFVVPCQWKGCKQLGEEQEILEHQNECEFKLYLCPYKCEQQKLYRFLCKSCWNPWPVLPKSK
ncbi:hypothetical protein RN001_013235 [Aquatica leii]|uniref:SIAH-type domain-containing protein n=1 Tax=Aquatica leii TaxID=1421715 RepID=A0AAN7PZR1_9COLE|nr:hypothetical protein RN001_013235 [Aquatica leii]